MTGADRPNRAGLVAAVLAGLALRRSGLVPHREEAPKKGGGKRDPESGEGHETEDVNVRNTVFVMGGLGLSAIAVIGGMVLFMNVFAARQREALPALTPQQTTALDPPPPNLQANPYADLDREQAANRALLEGYGYLDPERTRARIPIDRAMRLTVGRSLDAQGEAR
jgi:hypothetical protein